MKRDFKLPSHFTLYESYANSIILQLCVAFSRARHGLFCIGNFEMIAERLPAFKKILQSVADSVLDHFKLECEAHKNETGIRTPKDFFKVAEGGCNAPCKDSLDCGHMCPKQCHVYSNEDLRFKCIRPCLKKLERCGHACRNLCGENCGPCREIISTPLPSCGHILEVSIFAKFRVPLRFRGSRSYQ